MPTKEYYLEQIEKEFATARKALSDGNTGMARVCARRATGAAISWYLSKNPKNGWKSDAMNLLSNLKNDSQFPEEIRGAAARLTTKISEKFTYPFSTDPISDAKIITDYITRLMSSDDI
ncbi:MAG: hypothetical protein ACHQQQ_08250 [Bacteroidota bacterium]